MNDGEALHRACCMDPDDMAPRLIWADWLEEHGQPERAEFIRVQVELARIGHNHPSESWRKEWVKNNPDSVPICPKCSPLHSRSRELLDQFGERWAKAELVEPLGLKCQECNGTGYHRYPDFADGTANYSDSAPCHRCGGYSRYRVKPEHWARGMIERVELSSEAVFGQRCERCRHSEGYEPTSVWNSARTKLGPHCNDCHGAGRVGGCAAAIGRTTVREVRLTDKRPAHYRGLMVYGRGWSWWDDESSSDENSTASPKEIWELIELPVDPTFSGCKNADSEAAAITALARAVALHCRRLAFPELALAGAGRRV